MNKSIVVAFLCVASVASAQSSGVSGKWSLAIATSSGPEVRTFDIKSGSGESIQGTVESPYGPATITSGRATKDSLIVDFAIAGGQIKVRFSGALRGDTLRGVWRQDNEPALPFAGLHGENRSRDAFTLLGAGASRQRTDW